MITLEQLVDIQIRVGFAPFTPPANIKGTNERSSRDYPEQDKFYSLNVPEGYTYA